MVSRGWCWTVFDFESFDPIDQCTKENAIKYGIYQIEQCPDTGTYHIQGYYEFTRGVRRAHVQRVLCVPNAHCDPRRGSPEKAANYCRKSESKITEPTEFGDLPVGQGHRTDLEEIFTALDAGSTPQEVARAYPGAWARSFRAVDRYYLDIAPARTWPMETHVLYGPPGSGKSRAVHDWAAREGHRIYDVMSPNVTQGAIWFDGYQRQHAVLLDDFYGWLPWTFLLKLLDRYPLSVQTKGGVCPFLSKVVFITSNQHPRYWYQYGRNMQWEALERRITTITEYPVSE